jgi:hypothetical protein
MSRSITTKDTRVAAFLDPATFAAGGSSTYDMSADPGDDVVMAVAALSSIGNERVLGLPFVECPGGAADFDFTMAVIGFDSDPGAYTFADYRYAGDIVWPAKRYTRATATELVAQQTALVTHPYYAFVLTDCTTPVGGDVKVGLRFYDMLDNVALR